MNHVPMKRRAFEVDPDFWYELIYWDGGEEKSQQYREKGFEATTPERYRGWIQFGMWLLTPRVARQWNGFTAPRKGEDGYWPKMKEIVRAVDEVHRDPVLKRFWRHGRLVVNSEHEHPFNVDLPERYEESDRWFLLDTNRDPDRPWEFTTPLPVFSLARVIGEGRGGGREWLVYAHAPMGDRTDVQIEVPEYGKITVDVSLEGAFYHVREENGAITEVGQMDENF